MEDIIGAVAGALLFKLEEEYVKRGTSGVLITMAAAGLAIGTASIPAGASPSIDNGVAEPTLRGDNLPNPQAQRQSALRTLAVNQVLAGTAKVVQKAGSSVIEVRPGQYVQWDSQREESIFTMLVEFGKKTDDRTGGDPGPLHNEIEKPDRKWDGSSTDDNSTYWTSNFDVKHYRDLMFGDGESFKDFYLNQSNGKFLAKGGVSNWVKVPYNEARYGSNSIPEQDGYWNFIKDSGNAWYDAQVDAGKTRAEIKQALKQYDQWDRYDYDKDGNFNEPDGYIDHFQDIHAGEGEEAGGGKQGTDAIWSHRWFAFQNLRGVEGPKFNKNGGTQIGRSGIWIGDYTTEPENGGLGVFAHEFGHDLGLPDLYDTAGGDNGTGFWTVMSAGSWMNHGGNSIGTTPDYMDPWSKLFLGWLNYRVVMYGQDQQIKVGPAAGGSRRPQAVIVTLPDKDGKQNYYIAENRTYTGYDETLQTGPYVFGWTDTRPKWVKRFPYQNGLLVWYVDQTYGDNNTISHPGHGLDLPVDARPKAIKFSDGTLLGNRRQPFDATFGHESTDAVTFYRLGEGVKVPSQKAIAVFDDSRPKRYWSSENPMNSVMVAGSGTRIEVGKTNPLGTTMVVDVSFH
jgi:M6 family metalloprotease-like protein